MKSYDIPNFSEFYLKISPRYEFLKICVIAKHQPTHQPTNLSTIKATELVVDSTC